MKMNPGIETIYTAIQPSGEEFLRQQAIQARCLHPSGAWEEFPRSALVGSIMTHLAAWAEQRAKQPAIYDVNGARLTYGALYQQLTMTVARLRELGIGRNDRVAIVLPNGPAMAVAFLCVAACATCAPVNPAYRAPEFDFYLADLNAKAVIVDATVESPVREVARGRGIPIIELLASPTMAGGFTLAGQTSAAAAPGGFAEVDDIALILHTSGTTARPKMVPLTQRNLLYFAYHSGAGLELSPADRCLNLMPLFHIHGLVPALLAPLVTGGSVICTRGFEAASFFTWLETGQPTWYSAVPTIHQAIVVRAALEAVERRTIQLRFVRSGSAAMAPTVMADLERIFNAPVIEAYGMTEVTLQMASNPLPPLLRKPGSVGLVAGKEVAIMAEDKNALLLHGTTGEVVVRGQNVCAGYLNQPDANTKAFVDGWFRTGDLGYLDEDGYLFIRGRLKELINRGGEKVAPREVDEVLLTHCAVAQAVTFAVPHATLGEDVAAAVVLTANQWATEQELRHSLFGQIAEYKIPSQIVIVDEIPKDPTGKVQRIGLAERLVEQLRPRFVPPTTPLEMLLVQIWCEVLGQETLGITHNFFAVGGDSLSAMQVISRINRHFQIEVPLRHIFEFPTITALATIIAQLRAEAVDDSEVEALLTELEMLPEEQVTQLLQESPL